MKRITLLFTGMGLLLNCAETMAQDRLFVNTYQSGVLNVGQREIEVWNTLRSGKEDFYRALDSRIEFEFGVAKNLQTSFYLNMSNSAYQVNEYGNVPLSNSSSIETTSDFSFSNEWKLKLSDAAADALGTALYAEVGVAPRETELELKLIFDKKFNRITNALNVVGEVEWEKEAEGDEIETETEFKAELDYGFSYNINSNWNLGLEVKNTNGFEEGEWEYSALFAGPGFSYVKGPIWINFSVLPQVAGLLHEGDDKGLILDEEEKLNARLIFSYSF